MSWRRLALTLTVSPLRIPLDPPPPTGLRNTHNNRRVQAQRRGQGQLTLVVVEMDGWMDGWMQIRHVFRLRLGPGAGTRHPLSVAFPTTIECSDVARDVAMLPAQMACS